MCEKTENDSARSSEKVRVEKPRWVVSCEPLLKRVIEVRKYTNEPTKADNPK